LIEPVIVEEADDEGPYGVRGSGDPPILAMAPGIANAIYDAVGVRIATLYRREGAAGAAGEENHGCTQMNTDN
jgi:hypothetical protein